MVALWSNSVRPRGGALRLYGGTPFVFLLRAILVGVWVVIQTRFWKYSCINKRMTKEFSLKSNP